MSGPISDIQELYYRISHFRDAAIGHVKIATFPHSLYNPKL